MFNLHFLYPLWLWLLPVGLVLLLALYRFDHYQQKGKKWDKWVDEALQPFVISGAHKDNTHKRRGLYAIAGVFATFAILALSGPSLHKESVPLHENHQGLVIVLDLSSSMLSQDVKPSRVQRAKLAMIDLLKPNPDTSTNNSARQGYKGYVGLVVFAADAFTVAPLTNDVETLIAQLTHMTPAIMPAQGSRLDKAITQAVSLLANAGHRKGNILLVTDGLSDLDATKKATQSASKKGFKVSVLAIGTAQGATIPALNRQARSHTKSPILLNKQGKAVIATLDSDALKEISDTGKGIYLDLNNDHNAITSLLERYQSVAILKAPNTAGENRIEYWVNAGIWLLFPLLFMVLYLFRRGLIWMLCLVVLLPVDPVHAFDFNSLWLNQQQQAKQWLDKGETDKAQQLFNDHQWKAVAAYRAEDYTLAVQLFAEQGNARAWYNSGNALLKMEQLNEAINAYEIALEKQPEYADARYNLQLAKQALREQKAKQALIHANLEEATILQEKQLKADASQQDFQLDNQNSTENAENADKKDIDREREQQAFEKQWLKSVPDDPSGLWRRKFKYQYKKQRQQAEAQPW